MGSFNRKITKDEIQHLETLSRCCCGDIIKMTTIAGSGHPGGSMSSIDIYLTLFSYANISLKNIDDLGRDRIIISHGHTSPGVYACLAHLGFIDLEDALVGFRKIDSPYEGHIERHVPGIEWSTGNLGQGLSAACGFALASRIGPRCFNTFVVMSDGEQAKGQVSEARRFARKYNLNDLTVIIDHNHLQISGRIEDIMPVNIKDNYCADEWKVLEISGHSFSELHHAICEAVADAENPYAIICNTIMGHGISFMENNAEYHGRALTREEYQRALQELDIEDDLDTLLEKRKTKKIKHYKRKETAVPTITTGKPRVYKETTHPRAVFGSVLEEVAKRNKKHLIAVFDCDLRDSVKTNKFAKINPRGFFEAGVSEHNTATISGALSINGVVAVWADFGVFAVDEVYNQLRLNDINNTNLKIVATHLGYNVGSDGKTHHCIDYIGLLKNLPGFKLTIPGDPNQTDHITRYILNQSGNHVLGLTRTKLPVIITEDGKIFFDESYTFTYGAIDVIRDGKDCAIFTMGALLHQAVAAHDRLKESGIHARIYNVSSPLCVDENRVIEAAQTGLIITYEDHIITSGMGSIIAQLIGEENINTEFMKIGITRYGGSDTCDVLYKQNMLDTDSLVQTVMKKLKA